MSVSKNSKLVLKLKSTKKDDKVEIKEKKPKFCPHCDKVFLGKTNNLTRHIREQHNQAEFITKYMCPKCSFSSQWEKNIRHHLIHRHNVKRFKKPFKTVEVTNYSEYMIIKIDERCMLCFVLGFVSFVW